MYLVHPRTNTLNIIHMSESELKVNLLFFPLPPGKSNQLGLMKDAGRYCEKQGLTKCYSYMGMGWKESEVSIA